MRTPYLFSGVLFNLQPMEIFGKHIFGSDANEFRALPVLEQYEWIKKYTNQNDEDLINEFLSNIPENNDKNCLDCGNNKRERVSEPIEEVNVTNDTKVSSGTNTKGRGNNKRPKVERL